MEVVCSHGEQHLRLVQRGMIAVDSYEACVIDKIKLAETITEISIGCTSHVWWNTFLAGKCI